MSMQCKLLILPIDIKQYRLSLFKLLIDDIELDARVLFSESEVAVEGESFIKTRKTLIGKFVWQQSVLKVIRKFRPNWIIVQNDLHFLPLFLTILFKPFLGYKVALFGIGYGNSSFANSVRLLLSHLCDIIFVYAPQKKINYRNQKVIFNTVFVKRLVSRHVAKDSLIFVGSLNERKGLEEVFEIYSLMSDKFRSRIRLRIVGDGPFREQLKLLLCTTYAHISNDVVLMGGCYDENILSSVYARAICAISPKQAGLSVLQSLGHGVPFMCREDAISGGEVLAINSGETGFRYVNIEEAVTWLESLTESDLTFMSDQCLLQYESKYRIEHMAHRMKSALI